jgi:hypothetical protein
MAAETTSWAERKELFRLLVADVTLTRQENEILVQLRWHTNAVDTFPVAFPTLGAPPLPEPVVERVRELSRTIPMEKLPKSSTRRASRPPRESPFPLTGYKACAAVSASSGHHLNRKTIYVFKGALCQRLPKEPTIEKITGTAGW